MEDLIFAAFLFIVIAFSFLLGYRVTAWWDRRRRRSGGYWYD